MAEPTDRERRDRERRLDDVFGDVLPSVTGDELPDGDRGDSTDPGDDELLANRPPHHDRD